MRRVSTVDSKRGLPDGSFALTHGVSGHARSPSGLSGHFWGLLLPRTPPSRTGPEAVSSLPLDPPPNTKSAQEKCPDHSFPKGRIPSSLPVCVPRVVTCLLPRCQRVRVSEWWVPSFEVRCVPVSLLREPRLTRRPDVPTCRVLVLPPQAPGASPYPTRRDLVGRPVVPRPWKRAPTVRPDTPTLGDRSPRLPLPSVVTTGGWGYRGLWFRRVCRGPRK